MQEGEIRDISETLFQKQPSGHPVSKKLEVVWYNAYLVKTVDTQGLNKVYASLVIFRFHILLSNSWFRNILSHVNVTDVQPPLTSTTLNYAKTVN